MIIIIFYELSSDKAASFYEIELMTFPRNEEVREGSIWHILNWHFRIKDITVLEAVTFLRFRKDDSIIK
jgi:hypothetical protein